MSIRKFKLEDYQQIKGLEIQSHALHLKGRPDIFRPAEKCDVLGMDYFTDRLNDKECLDYVYVENGKIVGEAMSFIKEQTSSQTKKRRVLYVESIAVDNDCKHKGIGTKLMNHIKKQAEKLKFEAVELNVWAFNSGAIEFYKSLGMTVKNMVFESKIKKSK